MSNLQIVKVVEGTKPKIKSEQIDYDPILAGFQGFSKSNQPCSQKVDDQRKEKSDRNQKRISSKKQKPLKPKSELNLSKVLRAREVYRKMLENCFSSKFMASSNQIGHFEEYLKEHTTKRSTSKTMKVPEIVDLENNSDDEDIEVLDKDKEVQILNNISKITAQIELVELEETDEEEDDIVDVTDDESDYETDEDEKYYENKTFVKKECNIVVDLSTDEDNEVWRLRIAVE